MEVPYDVPVPERVEIPVPVEQVVVREVPSRAGRWVQGAFPPNCSSQQRRFAPRFGRQMRPFTTPVVCVARPTFGSLYCTWPLGPGPFFKNKKKPTFSSLVKP